VRCSISKVRFCVKDADKCKEGGGGGEAVEGGTRYPYIKQLLKSDKINFTRTPSE